MGAGKGNNRRAHTIWRREQKPAYSIETITDGDPKYREVVGSLADLAGANGYAVQVSPLRGGGGHCDWNEQLITISPCSDRNFMFFTLIHEVAHCLSLPAYKPSNGANLDATACARAELIANLVTIKILDRLGMQVKDKEIDQRILEDMSTLGIEVDERQDQLDESHPELINLKSYVTQTDDKIVSALTTYKQRGVNIILPDGRGSEKKVSFATLVANDYSATRGFRN